MNFTPMFAEDISPAVLVIIIVPAILVLTAFFSLAVYTSRRTGRPLKTELISKLGPVVLVMLLLLLFGPLVNRSGTHLPFIVILAILVGSRLLLRRRKPPEAQTEMKDFSSSSPRPAAPPFPLLSLPFMVGAWMFFLIVLVICSLAYLQSPWTSGTWILAGVSLLCLVLIPVQIIRYFRGKPK
jgi:hypothetical protein